MKSLSKYIEVLFIRHAESQSNALWKETGIDPWIFDPTITEKGYQQAIQLKDNISYFVPDLIVSSPLKRCLLTASIVFGETEGDGDSPNSHRLTQPQWIVHPLAIERLSEADDIGSLKRDLINEFPCWNWSLVPNDFWWYIPAEQKSSSQSLIDHQLVFKANPWSESSQNLELRISQFLNWLRNQPANKVVVFTHGSYMSRIVGGNYQVSNCESILKTYSRLGET